MHSYPSPNLKKSPKKSPKRLTLTPLWLPCVLSALSMSLMMIMSVAWSAEPDPSPSAPEPSEAQPAQPAQPNTTQPSNDRLARSGDVIWSVRDAEDHLKRYRAWLNWESSANQPLEVLEDERALRRILISTLEREVVVRYARAAELERGPILGRPQLIDWLRSLVPGAIRPAPEDLDHFIRGRLKMKAGDDLSFFWHAVEDAYWVARLQRQLVAELAEEDGRREWKRRGEQTSAWLMQIPRVPTSAEISQATKRYQREMKTYYDDNMKLFSQPVRLLVAPYWIRGGKLEPQRMQAQETRDRIAGGEAVERVIEEYPMLTQGGVKSIRGRSIPPNTEIKEGALTPIRLTRYGWTFYQIKRVYPAYVRALTERSVQREVAAAVLRARDDLPRARKLAQSALKQLERAESIAELKRWGRSRRIRVSAPAPFFASTQNVVPTVGLSPELHKAIIDAEVGALVPPIHVRQHYVIARIVGRTKRDKPWAEERDHFMKTWRRERTPQLLDEWLTRTLKDAPRWISTPKLKTVRIQRLKFEAPLQSK